MINRRQFFRKAAIGTVGVAAIPFMPWEAFAKEPELNLPNPMWRNTYGLENNSEALRWLGKIGEKMAREESILPVSSMLDLKRISLEHGQFFRRG